MTKITAVNSLPNNFTVADAAAILGCCEATILNRIKTGVILAFRVGRKYQIPAYEVRRVQQEAFEAQRQRVEARLQGKRVKQGCNND